MLCKEERDKLVMGHERLAWSIVNKFADESKKRGIDTADLYQVAMTRLVLLSRYYDPSRGMTFTGYSKRKLHVAVSQEFTKLSNIVKIHESAFQAKYANSNRAACAKRESSRYRLEFDMAMPDGSGNLIRDAIECGAVTPEGSAILKEQRDGVLAALKSLPDRAQDILISWIEDGRGSHVSMGEKHEISRERARQICVKSFEKMARALKRFKADFTD